MMLLSWIEVLPCVRSLEDNNHLVHNQQYVSNKRVGECTDFFRVSSNHRRPTENQSSSNHLFIVCKLLDSISAVRGIICINRSYQIIPQPKAEGLSIYSAKSSCVIFHCFQGLGPVPCIDCGYQSRVLVGFLLVPLVVHCAGLGELNISVCVYALSSFEVFDIINHAL